MNSVLAFALFAAILTVTPGLDTMLVLRTTALFAPTDLHHCLLQSHLCANNSIVADAPENSGGFGLRSSLGAGVAQEKRVVCLPMIEKIECCG